MFAVEAHVQVEATWGIYQRIVAAYRDPDRHAGKATLPKVIDALSTGVPSALTELITLGRTLRRRAGTSWPTLIAQAHRTGRPRP